MKESILHKLEGITDRYEELAGLMSDPDIIGDQNQFRKLSMEYSQIEPVVQSFREYQQMLDDKEAAQEMLAEDDADLKAMAHEEIKAADTQRP